MMTQLSKHIGMIDVLVLNLNCLDHTRNLVDDLRRQYYRDFHLTLVDQNSDEDGTEEYLSSINYEWVTVVRNPTNISIHAVWNKFVADSTKPFIALLNNDIRIPNNFLIDNVLILNDNDDIGMVTHPTNHPKHRTTLMGVQYEILPSIYKQGWDMCFRRSMWVEIPEILQLYCGDGFQYENMYKCGYKLAMAISSPIIHYQGATTNNPLNIHVPTDWSTDVDHYRKLGYVPGRLSVPQKYTIPKFENSSIDVIKEIHNECDYNE